MTSTYSEKLANFALNLSYDDIPAQVVGSAKQHILDTIGICLAAHQNETTLPAWNLVKSMGGTPESTIMGGGDKVPMALAALVNGTYAHGIDFDDTHFRTTIHPSASVVPTALAVGERQKSNGKEFLAAAVAGWEVIIALDAPAPGRFAARGFRQTAIFGTYGATLIAGKLLGLPIPTMVNAISICGSFGAGVIEFSIEGPWATKSVHLGWAANSGITAALLAQGGFTGPSAILEGKYGLYGAYLHGEEHDMSRLTEGLGKVWETPIVSSKPYPADHWAHAFLDCIVEIKARHGLRPEEIERVLCRVAEPIVPVCEPRAIKMAPPTAYEAKFSLPFCVATMILEDKVVVDSFTSEKIVDPQILNMARKVDYEIDPEAPFPKAFPGWVVIYTKDGRELEHKIDVNRGSPELPMTQGEIEEKFRSNAAMVLSDSRAEDIVKMVNGLEDLADVSRLARLCQPH